MNLNNFPFIAMACLFLAGALYLAMLCFVITALPIPDGQLPTLTTGQWIGIGAIRALLVLAFAGAYAVMVSFIGLGLSMWNVWDRSKGQWIAMASFAIILVSGLAGAGYFMLVRPMF